MSSDKARKIWTVNMISFILLAVLAFTGLINWLLLPRGYQAAGALLSLRHFLHDIHAWAALFFIIGMLVHWSLHWGYIQSNLKRYKRN
ncbi:MAG: DUF4405 domain-containing protein [Desulfatitalea sp.]|nr:DUF4405 domain-containing protein [Desulfatitalea sp.]MBI5896662.1 DUF4405 domain-containing protein [Desulfobacterales bacterium]